MKINKGIILLSTLIFTLFSCQQKSEYQKMLERELASGIRQDSLFYGIYLGMPAKEFYEHCWAMNKKGWLRQGDGNTTVYAKITEFGEPASMNFYPTFDKTSKIIRMPVEFKYDAAAPWNRHLSADSLKLKVKGLMEQWYGEGFIEVKGPNKFISPTAYVKVDGNRRTLIYKVNEVMVKVEFLDLLANPNEENLAEILEKK